MDEAMRERIREMASERVAAGDATGWFETLYADAAGDPALIPWADLQPHPALVRWLQGPDAPARGARALVVGCGLGDDAAFLAASGLDVTAFDIAPSAIEAARARFPQGIAFGAHDLFDAPPSWTRAFDLVFECYTLQALPADVRARAFAPIASFVAPGGRVLVVTRGREPDEDEGLLPWPLTRVEVLSFEDHGLVLRTFRDHMDDEDPPKRRFVASFERPSP